MDFIEFPKMARLSRECIITEKIDGTNAQIFIEPISKEFAEKSELVAATENILDIDSPNGVNPYVLGMFVGSRTQWITPEKDNYGFAKWVQRNSKELFKLGVGRHFGEWWGNGIQRGYGLKEKR